MSEENIECPNCGNKAGFIERDCQYPFSMVECEGCGQYFDKDVWQHIKALEKKISESVPQGLYAIDTDYDLEQFSDFKERLSALEDKARMSAWYFQHFYKYKVRWFSYLKNKIKELEAKITCNEYFCVHEKAIKEDRLKFADRESTIKRLEEFEARIKGIETLIEEDDLEMRKLEARLKSEAEAWGIVSNQNQENIKTVRKALIEGFKLLLTEKAISEGSYNYLIRQLGETSKSIDYEEKWRSLVKYAENWKEDTFIHWDNIEKWDDGYYIFFEFYKRLTGKDDLTPKEQDAPNNVCDDCMLEKPTVDNCLICGLDKYPQNFHANSIYNKQKSDSPPEVDWEKHYIELMQDRNALFRENLKLKQEFVRGIDEVIDKLEELKTRYNQDGN